MTVQPYGSWPSPITPEALLAGARTLAFPEVFEGQLYWMEGTPEEKGRSTVQSLSLAAGGLVPAPFNVRSRVHEYGGRAYAVVAGRVLFVNFQDQRLYAQPL
ncbi:MAG: S9 family peptidase, partial [Pseudomonadales bacterium]